MKNPVQEAIKDCCDVLEAILKEDPRLEALKTMISSRVSMLDQDQKSGPKPTKFSTDIPREKVLSMIEYLENRPTDERPVTLYPVHKSNLEIYKNHLTQWTDLSPGYGRQLEKTFLQYMEWDKERSKKRGGSHLHKYTVNHVTNSDDFVPKKEVDPPTSPVLKEGSGRKEIESLF